MRLALPAVLTVLLASVSIAAEPADAPGVTDASHAAEPPARSLVARQGLLVPAAFLAAASALSSTIVVGLRSRVAKPSAAAQEPSSPAD